MAQCKIKWLVGLFAVLAASLCGVAPCAKAAPSLADFWNGKATWVSDSNNIGSSFGFHCLSTMTNGSEFWAYYINNYSGPTGSIKSGTGRARSTDGLNWTDDGIVMEVGGAPQRIYEAEGSAATHSVGRAESDGWSALTNLDAAGYLVRGPLEKDINAGTNTAKFKLRVDLRTGANDMVVTMDVYDATTAKVLATRDVFRSEFLTNNIYQDFNLNFTNVAAHSLEFRTYWWDKGNIRQDKVSVVEGQSPFWDDRLATFPGIWKDGITWYLVYEGAAEDIPYSPGDIGLAASTDGKIFTKHPNNPILRHNTTGWEKVNIGTPSLYKENGIWYLFYHGYNGNFCRIGVATGTSLTNLTKYSGNPIIDVAAGTTAWDCGSAGKRTVVKEGSYYYVAYEGSTRQPYDQAKWSSGMARSTNLFDWIKFPGNPVIPQTTSGFGFDATEITQINGTWFMYVRTSDSTAPTKRFRLAAKRPAISTQP